MTRNPELHRAPLGYGKNGPLTWVAECRVPWEAPSPTRLAMAQWMIDNGSDIHQGGDGPLMRAALVDHRIPMMELLVRNGANVNAEWGGHFPIIYAPCETVEPQALRWLLDHGANPNCTGLSRTYPDTALDYVIGTYSRSPNLATCIDILTEVGCRSRRNVPAVLDILRGRIDLLAQRLDADPALVSARFPELDFGSSGARRLLLVGATLLHVASEYGSVEAAQLLLDRGADVNARADVDASGVGGQTPIFHAVHAVFRPRPAHGRTPARPWCKPRNSRQIARPLRAARRVCGVFAAGICAAFPRNREPDRLPASRRPNPRPKTGQRRRRRAPDVHCRLPPVPKTLPIAVSRLTSATVNPFT